MENNIQWRAVEVVGEEPRYEVSNTGLVKSLKWHGNGKARLLKPYTLKSGYRQVTLTLGGVRKRFRLHRLVAMVWIDNPDNLAEVNHKNFDKTDNSVKNLEWMTNQDNHQHATDHGKYKGGENGRAVLTESEVRAIRRLYRPGEITIREVAFRFGVSEGAVQGIIYRRKWQHLDIQEGEFVRANPPIKRTKGNGKIERTKTKAQSGYDEDSTG